MPTARSSFFLHFYLLLFTNTKKANIRHKDCAFFEFLKNSMAEERKESSSVHTKLIRSCKIQEYPRTQKIKKKLQVHSSTNHGWKMAF